MINDMMRNIMINDMMRNIMINDMKSHMKSVMLRDINMYIITDEKYIYI